MVPSGGTCGSTGEDDERRRRVNRQAGTDGRGPSRGGGATPLWEHGVKDCFLVRRAKGLLFSKESERLSLASCIHPSGHRVEERKGQVRR